MEELFELLRIPSVSADPERAGDVVRAAEWVRDFIRAAGGEAEVVPTAKHPLVVGEFRASENAEQAPTVIAYGHFDVQPEAPLDALGEPAVRADRAGRVDLRPRRGRRQGPALSAAEGRRAARCGRLAARQRSVHLRRRGGVRRPLDRRLPRGRRARRRRLHHLRRAHARARPARLLRCDARHLLLPRPRQDRRA